MTEDKSAVEKLAERWKSGEGDLLPDWDPTDEAARLLLAAIEADRAAGWINTAENYMFLHNLIAERDRYWAEVERLRAQLDDLRAVRDGLIRRDDEALSVWTQRAERAEAKLAEVRALADEWARTDMPTWMDGPRAAESLRAAVELD